MKDGRYLVMRLGVSNGLLFPTPVGQSVNNVAHVPIVVLELLQQLDPLVRNSHAKTIVKPEAALVDRTAHSRHPRHVLQNIYPVLNVITH